MYHRLETQRKHSRDFTGNQERMSVIISRGRLDIPGSDCSWNVESIEATVGENHKKVSI